MTELLSSLESPSDAELIARVRGGDLGAYGDLFERHVHAARRLARQLVRGPDSDDLVSDAFTRVMRVLQSGGGPDVAFRAYLLTAIRRLHVDKVRAAAKLTTTDDMTAFDPGVPFQDTAIEGFENGAAAKAFASLPERWQLVLWHLEVEGQKPADVAPLLGMSANSVSALAYRAREGLRQAFLTAHLTDTDEEACRWTTEHLGAFVRKGLSKRDSAKVQDHLDQCRRCTAMYLELNEVNHNLSAIIAPLLLGAAAAGYVSSGTGIMSGVVVLLDRAKDAIIGHATAATATGVAAGAAAVTAVAVVVAGGPAPVQNVAPQTSPTTVITSPAPTAGPTLTPPKKTNKPKPKPTFPVVQVPEVRFQPSANIRITSATISDNALVLDLAGLPQDRVVVNVDMTSSTGKTSFQPAKDQCSVAAEQPRHAECVSGGSRGGASAWLMAPSELQLVIPLRFPDDLRSDELAFLVTLDGYSDPDASDNTIAFTFTPQDQPTESPTPTGSPSPTGSPTPSETPTEVPGDMALQLEALDDHRVKATVTGLPHITLDLAFDVESQWGRMTEVPFGCLMVTQAHATCLITITHGEYNGVFSFDYPPGQAPVDITLTVSALLVHDDNKENNTATVQIGEHPGNPGGVDPSVSPSASPSDIPTETPTESPSESPTPEGLLTSLLGPRLAPSDDPTSGSSDDEGLLDAVSGLIGSLL